MKIVRKASQRIRLHFKQLSVHFFCRNEEKGSVVTQIIRTFAVANGSPEGAKTGMQCKSATLPDAVNSYISVAASNVTGPDALTILRQLFGKTEQHKNKSEDLPFDKLKTPRSAGLRIGRKKDT